MYKNIGQKIKGLAKALCILGIIYFALIGIVMIIGADGEPLGMLIGVGIVALGSILAWIGTWILYGFGELIHKTSNIEENIHR